MNIAGSYAVSSINLGKTTQSHVLANLGDLSGQFILNGAFAQLAFQQLVHSSNFVFQSSLCNSVYHANKLIVLGNKVGLGVNLNNYALLAVSGVFNGNNTLGSDTAGFLGSLRQALFTQEINSSFKITVGFGQSLFAVHHACAGSLTQFFYHCCTNHL